jgi:regulator of protease activity HflC (stomatin/prohibitin superfamily)
MKIIIKDHQRGFLIRNGRFIKLLMPGKHNFFGLSGYEALVDEISDSVNTYSIPLEVLLKDEAFRSSVLVVNKTENTVTLLKKDGVPFKVLDGIRHVIWNTDNRYQIEVISCKDPYIPADYSKEALKVVPSYLYNKIVVDNGTVGFLYFDGKLQKQLDAGVYYFWNNQYAITCETVDIKQQQLEIGSQEILTSDRVSIRLNILASYKVVEPKMFVESISRPYEQVYSFVQMTVRELIGQKRFDEILEEKDQISTHILEILKQKQASLGIAFSSAGIKDIILPGDVRDIMNRVLIAEKTAQANVIARREEVASTRSLLNTAKLMEENETLYKLKELEYLEKICDKVGSISVSGGDLLGQLRDIIGIRKESA